MGQNSRYRDFSLTWETNVKQRKLPSLDDLREFLEDISEEGIFQKERGEKAAKLHWQLSIKLKKSMTKTKLLEAFKEKFKNVAGLTIDPTRNKVSADKYCLKKETREEGPYAIGPESEFTIKEASRELLEWEKKLISLIKEAQSDYSSHIAQRGIIYVEDILGGSGKSTSVKWLRLHSDLKAAKIPAASVPNMTEVAVRRIQAGYNVFLIDIPRTQGDSFSLSELFHAIEDLKTGYVVSTMYGSGKEGFVNCPTIVIYSNIPYQVIKQEKYMSLDRLYVLKLCRGEIESYLPPEEQEEQPLLSKPIPLTIKKTLDEI